MSTTKQSQTGFSGIVELIEVKQRRRLANLLYTRTRVSQLAAEHRSHGLDDAIELYALQLEVEQVLSDEFPAAFEAHIPMWAEEEAAAEHHPRVVAETCSLCEAIAKHLDGDFDAPLAA
jgi:hypothetical protein